MHELSVAHAMVQTVEESLKDVVFDRVTVVHLLLGELAGVVPEALMFCYDIATSGTLLAGSRLEIEHQPVAIFCATCDTEVALPSIQSFRCPQCGTLGGQLRRGQEMLVLSVEVE